MPTSFSDLSLYQQCPRLFGFTKLGYQPITKNEPLTTGQLVHAGLASYFRNGNVGRDINVAAEENLSAITQYLSGSERYEAEQALEKALNRAIGLSKRYILHWAKDYTATLVEPELELGGVIIHPDLIATYQGQRVVVDFKTTHYTDPRRYAHSGQTDLYAYMLNLQGTHTDLIIYDIISEEGIYRLDYPPRLDRGEYLFRQIRKIPQNTDQLLAEPHWSWDCAGNCDFYVPCYLRDDDQQASNDYLESNYIQGGK
uniref:Putative PD-(D/E)XK nuclease superfamily protein n=1 Tax=viral metagenome TaxID=1070528 RepID=A0A6M3XTG3_9ZZZZ